MTSKKFRERLNEEKWKLWSCDYSFQVLRCNFHSSFILEILTKIPTHCKLRFLCEKNPWKALSCIPTWWSKESWNPNCLQSYIINQNDTNSNSTRWSSDVFFINLWLILSLKWYFCTRDVYDWKQYNKMHHCCVQYMEVDSVEHVLVILPKTTCYKFKTVMKVLQNLLTILSLETCKTFTWPESQKRVKNFRSL